MYYLIWVISAFIAVGVGMLACSQLDKDHTHR